MFARTMVKRLGVVGGLAAVLALSASCSGDSGVPQETYDKAQNDLEQAQEDLKARDAELQTLKAQVDELNKKAKDVVVLIGAETKPTATPAPTLAPGVTAPTAAPRPTAPPSYYEAAGPYFVYAETLATTTASKYSIGSTVSCVPSGNFIRGQRIVWRIEVVDLATGKRVTDLDGATLKIVLPNGDESTGRWGQRGGGRTPGAPFMWSFNWDIPLDYPLGGIDYKLTVAKDGSTWEWKPPALISETNDTRPKVLQ